MYTVLLAVLILDGILMGVIILLQAGKGGGLAAMGGGGGTMADQLIGGRQAATLLTKATWTTGGIFIFLSFVLSVMSSRAQVPSSLLEQEYGAPGVPQPVVPGQPGSGTPPITTEPPGGPGGATTSNND